jgi:hypothetical protein
VCSIGGKILTNDNLRTGEKSDPVTLLTTQISRGLACDNLETKIKE